MIGSLLAGLVGLALVAIGIGALVAPGISSTQYGLPATDRASRALIRALGVRDAVIGTIVLALLASGDRAVLAIALGVTALAAVGDTFAVATGRNDTASRHIAIHIAGAIMALAASMVVAFRL